MFILNYKIEKIIYNLKKEINNIYIIFVNEYIIIEEIKKKIKEISIINNWNYKIFFNIEVFIKLLIDLKNNNTILERKKIFLIEINKIEKKIFFLFNLLEKIEKEFKIILFIFQLFFLKKKLIEINKKKKYFLEFLFFDKKKIFFFIYNKLKAKKIKFKNLKEKNKIINLLINKYEDNLILLNQELKKIYILYENDLIDIKYIKNIFIEKENFNTFNIIKYILIKNIKKLFKLIIFFKKNNIILNSLITIVINFIKKNFESKNNFKKNKKKKIKIKNILHSLIKLYNFDKNIFNSINEEINWNKFFFICLKIINLF